MWYFCYNRYSNTNTLLSSKAHSLHNGPLLVVCTLWVWTHVWGTCPSHGSRQCRSTALTIPCAPLIPLPSPRSLSSSFLFHHWSAFHCMDVPTYFSWFSPVKPLSVCTWRQIYKMRRSFTGTACSAGGNPSSPRPFAAGLPCVWHMLLLLSRTVPEGFLGFCLI